MIHTVLGKIRPEELGITLMHEHIMIYLPNLFLFVNQKVYQK